MLKTVVVMIALIVAGFSANALAAEGPYVGANLGVTMTSDSDWDDDYDTGEFTFDPGFAFGVSFGQKFDAGRIEAEVGYKTAEMDDITIDGYGSGSIDGDISVLSLMCNGYFDVNASPIVKPFLMAGIGVANVTIDIDGLGDEDDKVFAYQLGAGIGFALDKKITMDFSYRYMGTSDPDFDGVEAEYGSHNLLAGIRVQF